jgi:hypothetical protein
MYVKYKVLWPDLLILIFSSSRAQVNRRNRFLYLIPHYMQIDPRRCIWGSHWKKNFLWVTIPSLKFLEGIFNANQKSRISFEWWEIDKKFQRPTFSELGSRNWIVMLFPVQHVPCQPKLTFRQIHVEGTAYTVETVHDRRKMLLKHNRKPWSLDWLVTLLPFSDAPSGRNWHYAIIDNQKNE